MTPDVQMKLQQLGYSPERAQEVLPTLIQVAQSVARFGDTVSPSELRKLKDYADTALAMARNF